jgi:2-polyprenyl-3-methyl-5-hydroxy-6-metoxy-1,4-benzoquinol methylase
METQVATGSKWKERELRPEWMDDPQIAPQLHHQALEGLRRINFFSQTGTTLAKPILRWARSHPMDRPLRILDLACGGGDVSIQLWKQLNRQGIACQVDGWDKSGTAVDAATELARQQHACARFEQREVLTEEIDGQWDVVFCSLFLHHLTQEESIRLLQRMWLASSQWMLVDDLLRSSFGLFLAHLGCRILTRSPVVHADGPQSVRAAYTREELRELVSLAGLPAAEESPHWPQRILLSWRRSE